MQRILEGDLLIAFGAIIERNHLLNGLEVEEIEWIGELRQELSDAFLVDMLFLVQRTLHLHL